ncbi:TonB-dependent receptor [Exilibacterium tricleocarpae]|uniref:TonB-dependent receptor n=1 Tax=Exilibacterium tricleocarpae TaxID=2591008 RepID=A0A545T666_9GAMM|nr:TonB-dependent receptor [Exilibacterium tricleocarpae]TQV72727.1 TonB-dependent receptor [Exilibacterium tricleocarpae]
MNKKNLIPVCTLISMGVVAPVSSASNLIEEVVVTAQKREQNLQEVGIAITAFSGDQLEAMGVEQSIDIAAFSPGVHISGNLAGQNTQFSIRGVTQNDFNDIIEAPNAAYLDEGYLAVAQAQTFAVFDIERVEILKGPQGTLFGRNATGGLVHYISKKPSFERSEGYVDITYGQFDTDADAGQYTLEAAAGGPLTDTLAARAALRYNRQDGYLNNLYPQFDPAPGSPGAGSPGAGAGADMGDDDTLAGRVTFLLRPNEDMDVTFSGNYASSEVATGPYQSKSTIAVFDGDPNAGGELINVIDTPANETRSSIIQGTDLDGGVDIIDGDGPVGGTPFTPLTRPVPGGDLFGYIDPDGDDFNTSSDFAFDDQGFVDTWGVNARLEWALSNDVVFTAITDFKDYEKLLFIDVDAAPGNQLANYAGVDATSFTQELRWSGESGNSRWVGGFFYLNIDNESDNGLKAPDNSIVFNAFGAPFDIGVVSSLETDSYSLFGQLEYDLTESLSATFGLRVIREEKDFQTEIGFLISNGNFTVNEGDFLPDVPLPGAPFTADLDSSDTLWTGKVQLDWQAGEDLLIYAGINRGVKAGSFNAPLLGAFLGAGGNPALPYDEEILLSYEAGFKATFRDGRTRLNGTAFYYDYSDYQAFLFVGVGGVVINADADNYGIELDLQTSLGQGLDAIFSLAWFDATVKDVPLRAGSPLPPRDVDPTYAPELQANAILRYEWPALGGMMHVRGDASYSDEFFYNLRNFDADKFDSYVMVNAGVGWTSSDEKWQLDFKLENLTDERAGVQGFDLATLCGCNEVAYRAPRWYGFSVKREF